jgi:hypothetical protein
MTTRSLLRVASLAGLAALASGYAPARHHAESAAHTITVFKDANCGCCKSWIEHLQKHSFTVIARDTADLSGIKRTARLPERLGSCHTGFVNGYVVEGHVPAADILRMVKEKPKIAGLSVPGMPLGSPGMEVGSRKDSYDVIAFNRDGTTRVYAKH